MPEKKGLNIIEPIQSDTSELAKHLRTVHFILLVTCTGFLTATFLDISQDVEKAYQHVREIIDLKRNWNPTWLQEYALRIVEENELTSQAFKSPFTMKIIKGKRLTEEGAPLRLKVIQVNFQGQNWTLREPKPYPMQDSLGWLQMELRLSSFRTLSDFKELWNHLNDDRYIYLFTRPLNLILVVYKYGSVQLGVDEEYLEWEMADGKTPTDTIKFVPAIAQIESWKTDFPKYNFTNYFLYASKDKGRFQIPLLVQTFKIDAQLALIKQLLNNSLQSKQSAFDWNHGFFEYSFRELNEITQEYQNLPLENIERILLSEKRRTGERLEVFGAKLPVTALGTWGIFILVGIQLYFWLHLNTFNSRVSSKDKAWEVAWIPLYSGIWPQVVFVSSALILPFSVVVLIGMRTFFINTGSSLELCLIGVGIVLSLIVTIATWKIIRVLKVNR